VFAGHDGGVSCGLFTKDGKNICSAGEDGSVRVWGPKTGACKHVFGSSSGGHQAEVTCLANSSDGEMLLSGAFL
jgi:angio-associated migratory cell protein